MRIGFILAGLLFFVNPNIIVVDFMPDFIGAILLLYGFARAAEIDERIAQARKNLYLLMFAGIGRFLCIFLTPMIDAKEYTWFLVFAFCFGIIEAYLFCRSMFLVDAGLTYLSLKSGDNEIYTQTEGSGLGMTVIFTIVKSVFSILPTLTYLVTDYGTVTEMRTNWTFVMWMLVAMNVLLVTVYGILWFIRMFRFWKPLAKSKFLANVEKRYADEYLANRPLVVYRDLKRITLLLTLGMAMAIPIRMDGMDILPDFVAGVFFIYAARYLYKMYPDLGKMSIFWASAYTFVSALEWSFMLWMRLDNYSQASDQGFSKVMGFKVFDEMHLFTTFVVYCVVAAVKLALFALLILSIRKFLVRMVAEHTGSITEIDGRVNTEKTMQVRRNLYQLLVFVMIAVVVAALMSVVTTLLFLWMPILQTYDMIISVVAVILLKVFAEKLLTGMDDRYYHEV